MDIFSYNDYKKVIEYFIQKNATVKGYRSLLCKAARIHVSYLAQVLNKDAHLSSEQALSLSEFLGLTDIETKYFLTLLDLNKCGIEKHKGFYKDRLNELYRVRKESAISSKVNVLKEGQHADWYSSDWLIPAIRCMVSANKKISLKEMEDRLGVELRRIEIVVDKLIECGFLQGNLGDLKNVQNLVSVNKKSMRSYLIQGRLRSIDQIQKKYSIESSNKHAQLSFATSKEAFKKIHELVGNLSAEIARITREDNGEEICAHFSLDLFTF